MKISLAKEAMMRILINYIRSWFCKHDWELIDKSDVYLNPYSKRPYKTVFVYRCKKCCCSERIVSM